jgi:CrcB protein
MDKYLIMASGAILGAFSRYWMGNFIGDKMGTHFAYGVLLINLIGSFVLGLFLTMNLDRGMFTPNARLFVAVGWCASFTTYSTFSWDTFRYIQEGNLKLAAANVSLTLIGCLGATWAGATLGKIV